MSHDVGTGDAIIALLHQALGLTTSTFIKPTRRRRTPSPLEVVVKNLHLLNASSTSVERFERASHRLRVICGSPSSSSHACDFPIISAKSRADLGLFRPSFTRSNTTLV
ncbi:hypothetical protein C8R44DRAFT_739335 [Mycena epipterygia]|nr:hypothetical protein C8R44DRAFT_739335 [Mycena epipterygia]